MNRRIAVAGALAALATRIVSGRVSAVCSPGPGANLGKCDFSDQDLHGVNLSGANLGKANFTNADLTGANFSGANISTANFTNADLTGANVAGTNFSQAKLCGTTMPDGSISNRDC